MTQVPASSHGGGFTPVSCVLDIGLTGIDIHTAGAYPLKWSRLADNVWDYNLLAALPSGLGLALSFDGSSAAVVPSVAGTWAFTLQLGFPDGADATLRAEVLSNFGDASEMFGPTITIAPRVTLTSIVTLPSGAAGSFEVDTVTQPTANPYHVLAQLIVVRIA